MDKMKSQAQVAAKTNSAGRNTGKNAATSSPASSAPSSQQGGRPQTGGGGGRPQSIPSCGSCGTVVTKDTKALQCDRCLSAESWKCVECLNLSSEMYEYLADSNVALRWFCESCDKAVMNASGDSATYQNQKLDHLIVFIEKLMSRYENIEKELTAKCNISDLERVDLRVKELEDRLSKYDTELQLRLASLETQQANRTSCASASEQVHPPCPVSDEEMIKLVVQEEINKKSAEERDTENRKRNIILYRVPEKVTDNVAERKASDTTFVTDLPDAVWNMSIKEQDIEKMYRLGHWTEDKVRPLLVTFRNVEVKEHIMANLRDLSQPIEKFGGIGVSHDLHPKEREEMKKMVEDARQDYIAAGNDDVENFKFLVVGQGSRRKVIKVKRHKPRV